MMLDSKYIRKVLGSSFKLLGSSYRHVSALHEDAYDSNKWSREQFACICKTYCYIKHNSILTSWLDRDCWYCEINDNEACFSSEEDEADAIFQAVVWLEDTRKVITSK